MTTHADMIYALGGVPTVGGGDRFYGWWGKNVYFVDFDDGSDDNDGLTIDNPKKDLRKLLYSTGGAPIAAQSTVYIKNRPMASTTTNDVQYIDSQTSSGQFFIPTASWFTSIIGAAPQMITAQGGYHTYLRGSTTCTTGPVLAVLAYGCAIENIAFHRGGITSGSLWKSCQLGFYGSTEGISHLPVTAGRAAACTVNNCLFRWAAPGTDGNAALNMIDTWYIQVTRCHFYNCARGIHARGIQTSSPRECAVRHCTFSGGAANWSYGIYFHSSNMRGNMIDSNVFGMPTPTGTTGGVSTKYIGLVGSDTGSIISNNYFNITDGHDDITTITNVGLVGNYDDAADFLDA
jgi:hypothetical protein